MAIPNFEEKMRSALHEKHTKVFDETWGNLDPDSLTILAIARKASDAVSAPTERVSRPDWAASLVRVDTVTHTVAHWEASDIDYEALNEFQQKQRSDARWAARFKALEAAQVEAKERAALRAKVAYMTEAVAPMERNNLDERVEAAKAAQLNNHFSRAQEAVAQMEEPAKSKRAQEQERQDAFRTRANAELKRRREQAARDAIPTWHKFLTKSEQWVLAYFPTNTRKQPAYLTSPTTVGVMF